MKIEQAQVTKILQACLQIKKIGDRQLKLGGQPGLCGAITQQLQDANYYMKDGLPEAVRVLVDFFWERHLGNTVHAANDEYIDVAYQWTRNRERLLNFIIEGLKDESTLKELQAYSSSEFPLRELVHQGRRRTKVTVTPQVECFSDEGLEDLYLLFEAEEPLHARLAIELVDGEILDWHCESGSSDDIFELLEEEIDISLSAVEEAMKKLSLQKKSSRIDLQYAKSTVNEFASRMQKRGVSMLPLLSAAEKFNKACIQGEKYGLDLNYLRCFAAAILRFCAYSAEEMKRLSTFAVSDIQRLHTHVEADSEARLAEVWFCVTDYGFRWKGSLKELKALAEKKIASHDNWQWSGPITETPKKVFKYRFFVNGNVG